MKRLDELGVSPAPWTAYVDEDFDSNDEVRGKNNEIILCDAPRADARLVAAAPDLYECLRKAVCNYCRDRICWDRYRNECLQKDNEALSDNEVLSSCPAKRWRKALEKAGGVELSGSQIKVNTTRKRKGGEVMEKHEIESELNDIERDLADIARRAHIAASNLRSLAEVMERRDCLAATLLAALAVNCEHLDRDATRARGALVVSHKEIAALVGHAESETEEGSGK